MSNLRELYNIELSTISPVFISTWEEIPSYNYVVDDKNNKVIFFDISELLSKLTKEWNDNKDILEKYVISNDFTGLRKKVYEKFMDGMEIRDIKKYEIKVDKKFKDEYKNEMTKEDSSNQLNIKEFMNHKWYFYIPWSSIKWTLETALGIENSKEFWNFIMVEDSIDIRDKISVVGTNLRSWKKYKTDDGSEKKQNIFFQIFNEQERLDMNLTVRKLFNEDDYKKYNYLDNEEKIVKKINKFYEKRINSFKEQLKKFEELTKKLWENEEFQNKKKELESIYNFFETNLDFDDLKENEFYLNLGFWGSFWWKSFYQKHPNWKWIKKEEFKKPDIQIPRTFWKINENMMFWWVKCSLTKK